MALAVLNLSVTSNVLSNSRVLGSGEWQSLVDAAQLRKQVAQAVALARDNERAIAASQQQQQVAAIEARLQKGALLKALSLQIECEHLQREWRGQFVQTVMSCVSAMLSPPPPAFFARVQASAASMLGDALDVTLHVAPNDEAAARDGLSLAMASATHSPVRIVVDPDLAPGQCFLDTRFGRIQAGLPTQLEALNQALDRWWSNAEAEAEAEADVAVAVAVNAQTKTETETEAVVDVDTDTDPDPDPPTTTANPASP
jgi:flagellar biosynthesis/type III secretory pathway protein FliH